MSDIYNLTVSDTFSWQEQVHVRLCKLRNRLAELAEVEARLHVPDHAHFIRNSSFIWQRANGYGNVGDPLPFPWQGPKPAPGWLVVERTKINNEIARLERRLERA